MGKNGNGLVRKCFECKRCELGGENQRSTSVGKKPEWILCLLGVGARRTVCHG